MNNKMNKDINIKTEYKLEFFIRTPVKIVSCITILCILLLALFACSGESKLSGSYVWTVDDAYGSTQTYTFSGTNQIEEEVKTSIQDTPASAKAKGTYKISGNTIEITWTELPDDERFQFVSNTRNFEQKGSSLIIGTSEYKKK